MIKKYQRKPITIEAIQFKDKPEIITKISDWLKRDITINYNKNDECYLIIHNKFKEDIKVYVDDYIILELGCIFTCEPDLFEILYEEVQK